MPAKRDTSRDGIYFAVLPWVVMDCPSYQSLSYRARAMLAELARQINPKEPNNGRLLLSREYMRKRGWYSADAIQKSKRELVAAGFIFETCMGQRPNKASWYAVTWRSLAKLQGYDEGAALLFQRGAYASKPGKAKRLPPACGNRKTGASVIPSGGQLGDPIEP